MTVYGLNTEDVPSRWYPAFGPNAYAIWNPTSADFGTAGGSGALPGTAIGSQCYVNTATDWNGTDTMIISANATGGPTNAALTTVASNKRYTLTASFGVAKTATLTNGSGLGFIDFTQAGEAASTQTLYPNGWYDLGSGNSWNNNTGIGVPEGSGIGGWGGMGDISFSNTLVGNVTQGGSSSGGLGGSGSPVQAGDGIGVMLSTCAGTCWSNVRLISQNWTPAYADAAGGTMTWDNSSHSNWSSTSATQGGANYANTWASGIDVNSGEDAVFEGNGGTVTVSGNPQKVNSINFYTDWRTRARVAGNAALAAQPGYAWVPTYTINADPVNGGTITLTGDAMITAGAGTDQPAPDDSTLANVGGGCSLISCPIAGSNGMYKAGAGYLILTGANTYTGTTTVNGWTGTTIVGGGTLMLGYGGTATPFNGGTSGTIQGDVVNLANLAFNYSSAASSGVRTFTGNISGTGSVDVMGNGGTSGPTIFTQNNTYTGVTTIHYGAALQLGNGSTSSGGIGGNVVDNGTLIFNRSSTTFTGTIYDGSALFPPNGSTSAAGYGYYYMYGGETAHAGNLTQAAASRLTIGDSQMLYTGTTTISGGGALQVNSATSSAHVLTTTKTNITNGYLVLDYSASGVDLISTVQSLLHTSYGSNFLSGQLYDSTAVAGNIGLGSWDNTTTHQITVMPAVFGDCDGSGQVNTTDLGILLSNWYKTGVGWAGGDFTYSGQVTTTDLGLLLSNWYKSGTILTNIPAAEFQEIESNSDAMSLLAQHDITITEATPAPEPSSIVMLVGLAIAGTVWGIRRRRRNTAA
jgi:autotransporter-associated beta strand protein